MSGPIRLFYAYAPEDEPARLALEQHLSALQRQGLVSGWKCRLLQRGEGGAQPPLSQLPQADLVLLLISADSLALCSALAKSLAEQEDAPRLVPVLCRPVAGMPASLEGSLVLPQNRVPVQCWSDPRDAWTDIERGLSDLIIRLTKTGHRELWATEDALGDEEELLKKVTRICYLREAGRHLGLQIVRRRSEPFGEYAEVHGEEPGFRRRYLLTSRLGTPTPELIDQLFAILQDPRWQSDPPAEAIVVYAGAPPPASVNQQAREQRIWLTSLASYFSGLFDARGYVARQTTKLESDPVYAPTLYVSQRMEHRRGALDVQAEDALARIDEWLQARDGSFLLVLGDFGTGKTFLLRQLARRMASGGAGPVPFLIQLRQLEKGGSLDSLLAQHLVTAGERRPDLDALRFVLEEGRAVLLFDGFDELALRVTYERAAEHLETLMEAAQGRAKILVTSRTQHFVADSQVRTALGERLLGLRYPHRIVRLLPFDEEQIQCYLSKRLGDEGQAGRWMERFRVSQDLLGLAENPRMLNCITQVPEERLLAAQGRPHSGGAARLYNAVLSTWLEGEQARASCAADPGLTLQQRWAAVEQIALLLWNKAEASVRLEDLPGVIRPLLAETGKVALDVAAHQVGSGTLLSRDEEGRFSFIHRSVLEWLVAQTAARQLTERGSTPLLNHRRISALLADFFTDIVGPDAALAWAQSTLGSDVGEQAKANALLVLQRLGTGS